MRVVTFVVLAFNLCFCEKTRLNLLVLLPYFNVDPSLNPSWADGDNVYPALQLARDQINGHPMILQNYTLGLVKGESGCQHVEQTMVSFVKEAYKSRRRIVGLLGPGCSSSTIALAPVTTRNEVSLVMVHGSGSPILESRARYFYSIGTLGSAQNFINGLVYLARRWGKLAILYDESRQFYSNIESFLIKNVNFRNKVQYLTPVSFQFLPLHVIQELRLRVILVLCPPELTRRLICLSWTRKMVYSDYQYVYLPHAEQDLVQNMTFEYEGMEIFCTETDMQEAINKQFLLVYSLLNSDNGTLDTLNTSVAEYFTKYKEYREIYNNRSEFLGREAEFSHWTTYFYDSIWAWGLALDHLTKEYPNIFDDQHHSNPYGHSKLASMIMEKFYSISFEGISGSISFNNSTGYTPRSSLIIQFENKGPLRSRGKVIAKIDSSSGISIYSDPNQIPASFLIQYVRESQHLSWFFIIIDIVLLILTFIMEMMTWKFRGDAAIKATTPKLLHLSYAGIYVMLLGQLVLSMYSGIPVDVKWKGTFCCVSWAWTFPIGFTLSLGPVAMRTWRLYRIFIHYMNPGRFISNKALVGGVLVLLTVDLIVASLWTGLDTVETETVQSTETSRNDLGLKTLKNQAFCTSKWYQWWLLVIIANKSVLLVYVIALAILTRKIKKLSFTTSSLHILVYATVIVLLLGISLYFVLSAINPHPTYGFAAISLALIAVAVIFIICVFFPPLLPSLRPLTREIYLICNFKLKNSNVHAIV